MPPAKLVRVIERARHVVGRVHQRSVPPVGAMMEMIIGAWRAQGIAVAAELRVADALASGPLTGDELARRVGADPDALSRLMRALISEGIFTSGGDGRFALNALGETLGRTHPCRWRAWPGWADTPTTANTEAACSTPSGPVRPSRPNCGV